MYAHLQAMYVKAGYEVSVSDAFGCYDMEVRRDGRPVHYFVVDDGRADGLRERAVRTGRVARLNGATAWIMVPTEAAAVATSIVHPERAEGPRLCTWTQVDAQPPAFRWT